MSFMGHFPALGFPVALFFAEYRQRGEDGAEGTQYLPRRGRLQCVMVRGSFMYASPSITLN